MNLIHTLVSLFCYHRRKFTRVSHGTQEVTVYGKRYRNNKNKKKVWVRSKTERWEMWGSPSLFSLPVDPRAHYYIHRQDEQQRGASGCGTVTDKAKTGDYQKSNLVLNRHWFLLSRRGSQIRKDSWKFTHEGSPNGECRRMIWNATYDNVAVIFSWLDHKEGNNKKKTTYKPRCKGPCKCVVEHVYKIRSVTCRIASSKLL